MAKPPISDQSTASMSESRRDGSALCTHCGMCCMGVIHDAAVLDPDEIDGAREIGLPVEFNKKWGFSLPCPKLEGTICTIYGDRPRVCGRYRCQLLQDFEDGAISFEDAIGHIDVAKKLMLRTEAHMRPGMTFNEVRAATVAPATDSNSETNAEERLQQMQLRLEAMSLNLYVDLHFRNSRDGRILGFTSVALEKQTEKE